MNADRWKGFWAWWVLGSVGDVFAILSDIFDGWSRRFDPPLVATEGTE